MVARKMQRAFVDATGGAHRQRVANRQQTSGDALRVLYVVSMFPCWSETFIAREIAELMKSGVDVHVLSLRPWKESFRQQNQSPTGPWVIYPPGILRCLAATVVATVRHPGSTLVAFARSIGSLWMEPIQLVKTLGTLVRMHGVMSAVRVLAPDHIHAHWATYPSTAALFMAGSLDIGFSFTAHAHDIFVHDQLLKEKIRRAAFVATISEFNRNLLVDRYKEVARGKIEIVHCGVTEDVLQRKRSLFRNRQEGRPARILSIGRLDEIKGFPTLLDACQLLDEDGVSFTCDIVGDGPLRDRLEKQVRRRNLQHKVHLFGALPSGKVYRLMAGADMFVLACQQGPNGNMDGIPVVLMEAMSIGVPCISTRLSGIPELIEHERNGLLVDPGDSEGISTSIKRLLDDPELGMELAIAARKTVSRYFRADRETLKLRRLFASAAGAEMSRRAT